MKKLKAKEMELNDRLWLSFYINTLPASIRKAINHRLKWGLFNKHIPHITDDLFNEPH